MAAEVGVALALAVGIVGLLTSFNKTSAEPLPTSDNFTDANFLSVYKSNLKSYYLGKMTANPKVAEELCHKNNGHLVTFQNPDEFQSLIRRLKNFPPVLIWTGGVSFSNSSVDELLLWGETQEPMSFSNFEDTHVEDTNSARNRRAISNELNEGGDNCDCNCDSTTLAPFTRAPCRKPTCHITSPDPPCIETKPKICHLAELPLCKARQNNCTVDCNEPCRIVEQPKCTLKPLTKPRCILKQPGPCETTKANCTIVSPGSCRADKPECVQVDSPCQPKIVPCKKSCAEVECTTIEQPCTTQKPPCEITLPPGCNNPTKSPCRKEKKCRQKRTGDDVNLVCELVDVCSNNSSFTLSPGPDPCEPITTCPPSEETTCPPPISHCTRPFVDCSPEYCQSFVQLCLPPKIMCHAPRIICDSAKVECEASSKCPEPEVECLDAEIECTKAKIECPDALVHCEPIITSCGHAPLTCTEAEFECKESDITCDKPVTCPIEGPPETYSPCCRNKCSGGGGRRRGGKEKTKRRDSLMLPTGAEYVEKIRCVAMRKDLGYKWVTESCNVAHNFLCEVRKTRP